MALETIDADRGKIVTGTAKMRGVGKRDRICIGSGNCMTVQTFREAVLFAARAFEHSFIALVLEEFHVIAPHEVGVFDTGITPALMSRGAIIPVNARLLSPFTPGTLGGPTHAAVAKAPSPTGRRGLKRRYRLENQRIRPGSPGAVQPALNRAPWVSSIQNG